MGPTMHHWATWQPGSCVVEEEEEEEEEVEEHRLLCGGGGGEEHRLLCGGGGGGGAQAVWELPGQKGGGEGQRLTDSVWQRGPRSQERTPGAPQFIDDWLVSQKCC